MSKSRGNTVDPDDLVASYGADTVRLFLMFMGPWDQGGPWSPTGIGGVHRFLNRLWTIALDPHGREPGDPDAGTLPAGVDEAAARRRDPAGGPPDAARRDRRLRGVPLQHDDRQADGAGEPADAVPRHRGRRLAPSGTRRSGWPLLMLAPAAPHITEELWSRRLAAAGAAVVVDPPGERGRRSIRRPSSRRPARSRSRSTASSATRSPSRPTSPRPTSRRAALASERVQAILAGREPLTGHPGRRRPAGQHRRPRRRGGLSDATRRRAPRAVPASPAPDEDGSRARGALEADVDRLLAEHPAELQAIERALRATIRGDVPGRSSSRSTSGTS